MTSLIDHIKILQSLNVPYKAHLIRIVANIFQDHYTTDKLGQGFLRDPDNVISIEELIDKVMTPPPSPCSPYKPLTNQKRDPKKASVTFERPRKA